MAGVWNSLTDAFLNATVVLATTQPGLGDSKMETSLALETLRLQVMSKCQIDVFHSKHLLFRTGLMYTPTGRKKSSRKTFVYLPQKCDFHSWKSNATQRVTWICRLSVFRVLAASGEFERIPECGEQNYITGVGKMVT